MKTLLISAAFSIIGIVALGQRNTPSEARESGSNTSQQSLRNESYQQSSRTESYQQPAKAEQQNQSRTEPSPQEQKTSVQEIRANSVNQVYSSDKKINPASQRETESGKSIKDRENKNGQARPSPVSNEKEAQTPLWKCAACGRVFNDYPRNGLCPYDGTIVGRIR